MRILALAVLTIAVVLTAAPARSQTYDPNYPVCLHLFARDGDYFECAYFSLAQCARSASGRAAMCVVNPYFAGAYAPAPPRHRRHRSAY
jgi:hypothetical protein